MRQKTRTVKLSRSHKKPRIAIVASRFNENICEGLLRGACQALAETGIPKTHYDIFRVPGAYEIPLAAKKAAQTKRYQGILCLGAVIRGETPHFEYISEVVSLGIHQVSLETGIPLGFGVITTNNLDQATARSGPNEYNKGRESALTVLEMIDLLQKIK